LATLVDYDVAHGRTWPLVLAWIAVGPAAAREIDEFSPPRGSR
jgi:hypothetical protein